MRITVVGRITSVMMNLLGESAPEILPQSLVPSQLGMRAALYRAHGNEDVIEICDSVRRPILKDSHVLVQVHTCALNPVDVKLRENQMPTLFLPLPKIIGSDVCGVVVERGKRATDKFKVGDKVIAMMPHVFSGWGAACEYAAIEESHLALAPSNVTTVQAGSLPLVSLTVLQATRSFIDYHRGNTAGRSVLIQAGSGGLGTFAIQYCKNELGMKVYATCGPANVAFLKSLGADVVIDYTTQRFEEVAVGMDLVFDPMAYLYEERTFRSAVLKNTGSFYLNIPSSYNALTAAYTDPLPLAIPEAAPHRILLGYGAVWVRGLFARLGASVAQYGFHYVHPDGAALAEVTRLVQEGKVRPVVEAENVFPLQQMAAANRKVREGHVRGKVVVVVNEDGT